MNDSAMVVSGVGAVTALGTGAREFAAALRAGRCGIRRPGRPELADVTAAGELGTFSFPEALAALPRCPEPVEVRARSATHRASLSIQSAVYTAVEAWLDAGLDAAPVRPERLGLVVAGSNLSQRYQLAIAQKLAAGPEYLDPRYAVRFLDTDLVGILSEVLGIRGEGFTVGGASASGNVAIGKAWQLLRLGELDACLVVGPVADLSPLELHAFRNIGALHHRPSGNPEEACRPFDRGRDGFVFGQGAACLVLERGDSARARGASARAAIAGASLVLSATRQPAPDRASEAAAMRRALEQAGVGPERVGYLNAHGTSSTAGDEVEVDAIREVFGRHVGEMWVNSTKGLTGHCLFSAGVVECVATVAQMAGEFVHPNANLHEPIDPGFRFCGAERASASFDVALSNSFGFGGINTSVVIRKA